MKNRVDTLSKSSFGRVLRHVQVALEYPGEGLLELLVGEGVAEGVHGAVGVAEEVGEHEEVLVRAGRIRAEALDQGEHVVRRPAGDESAEDEGYRAESLARPVLGARLLTAERRVLLLGLDLEALADRLDEVATRAAAVRALHRGVRLALRRLALRVRLHQLLLLPLLRTRWEIRVNRLFLERRGFRIVNFTTIFYRKTTAII